MVALLVRGLIAPPVGTLLLIWTCVNDVSPGAAMKVLSSITVLFRDIRDILANLLTFWFFATPIIYSWRDLPQLKRWFDFNPFTHLAVSYQEILFFPDNAFGHRNWLLALGAASVVMFLVGYWVFDRLRDTFAEAV